jgi:biopolymer transport protein ExbB
MNGPVTHALAYWQSGGPLLVPLAAVCFGVWWFYLRTRGQLLRAIRGGRETEAAIPECISPGGLFPPSPLGGEGRGEGPAAHVVNETVSAVQGGSAAGEAFDREAERTMTRVKRDVVILAALTAAAPLLGLLGTVLGMIETFEAVGAAGRPAERVAAGISRALITTQLGLVVAIPGVFGLHRVRRLSGQFRVCLAACKARLLLCLAAAGRAEVTA